MEHTIKPEVRRPEVALYTDIVYKNDWNGFRQHNCPLTLNFLRPFYNQWDWKKVPLIIWLEGGAWRSSPPARRIPELSFYAYHGYAVASVQYRVSSQSLWPAQIEDVKDAIRFLKTHHEHFGIDPDRIVIAGESAGAHLAALAALTGGTDTFRTDEWKDVDDKVQGAVCWYCPGTFSYVNERGEKEKQNYVATPEKLLVNKNIQEMPELIKEVSPETYVNDQMPPFLFFHGNRDNLVPVKWSKSLYDKIIEKGGEANYYYIDGAGHASIEFTQTEVQEIMLVFFDKQLKK